MPTAFVASHSSLFDTTTNVYPYYDNQRLPPYYAMPYGNPPSKTFDPVKDLPNMKGKVAIVTGSSSGIGFATLQHLLRMGAKVYMATPDEKMTQDALSRIENEGREPGLGEVIWHELDLKDPRNAKSSAQHFLDRETRLDVLINNAALISDMGHPTLNADGVQDNMAINYLGPFVFTRYLLPVLKSTASMDGSDVRIVNVGSAGYVDISPSKLKYQTIEGWNQKFSISMLPTLRRYQYSKVAVHLWTNNFAKQMAEEDPRILVVLAHPGAILSDGAKRGLMTLPFPRFWLWIMSLWMYPQSMGAYTSVFAACAPRENKQIFPGAYICPPNIAEDQKGHVLDPGRQQELLDFTETIIERCGL
ncbi:hypothetical protein D9757_008351 [Collybiopsis confluens]|uniref:NAD(P)-binding protein n=1 Tax=Collybiopsis confluens TaxID=2823264 RepID=A0A8H5HE37_9AGAR|nr:hypothetical protein D9757_008351 [Collybiopsis confluens]